MLAVLFGTGLLLRLIGLALERAFTAEDTQAWDARRRQT